MQGNKYKILAISGSIRANSTNGAILKMLADAYPEDIDIEIFTIADLPHFIPNTNDEDTPAIVKTFRALIEKADGVILCTPEYVFSVPAILKNAIEWTVSTTVFSDKPVAIIVASGVGEKTYESLTLIMKTVGAVFDETTALLIQGARSKFDEKGRMNDKDTLQAIDKLMQSFIKSIKN